MAILSDAMGAAEGGGDGGDEHCTEINAEGYARSGKRAGASRNKYVGHYASENFLHFRVGREKSANNTQHFVQRGRVGAEKAEKVPEEEETGGESKKELIGHLS